MKQGEIAVMIALAAVGLWLLAKRTKPVEPPPVEPPIVPPTDETGFIGVRCYNPHAGEYQDSVPNVYPGQQVGAELLVGNAYATSRRFRATMRILWPPRISDPDPLAEPTVKKTSGKYWHIPGGSSSAAHIETTAADYRPGDYLVDADLYVEEYGEWVAIDHIRAVIAQVT